MIKNKMFQTKEFKVKLIIVASLLAMVILSFFFADKIETIFNLKETYMKNQVSADAINRADFEVTYLDVGQGNCAVIRLPDGKVAVVDGGNVVYGKKIVDFLKSKNVERIDYLIATHADVDHIGGLLDVLLEFEVKNIYRPFQIAGSGTSSEDFVVDESEDLKEVYLDYQEKTNNRSKISRVTSEIYSEFIELVYDEFYFENGKKIQSSVTVFYDGLKISGENYSFEFFAPLIREDAVDLSLITENTSGFATVGYGSNESNGNSAIFLFSCYGETFMFSGDAPFTDSSYNSKSNETFEELDFIKSLTDDESEMFMDISVYLLAHHGSEFSSSEDLLKILNPKFVIVSVGKDNDYGHPSLEVIERVKNTKRLEEDFLLRTDEMGNITFASENGELKYSIENYERNDNLTISWYELGFIIFISFSFIIVFIKPKSNKRI